MSEWIPNELNARERAFVQAVLEVCRAWGYSIGHEDSHGAFLISNYDEGYSDWLEMAYWDPHHKDAHKRPADLSPRPPA